MKILNMMPDSQTIEKRRSLLLKHIYTEGQKAK